MKTVLITGSSGFIGQKICTACSENFNIITLNKKGPSVSNKHHIAVQGDITNSDLLEGICKKYMPDIVIHCAGIAHQRIGKITFDTYFKVNSLATEQLAKTACVYNPDVHVVFLSSIAVYGEDRHSIPLKETASCCPSSDYGRSKYDAEKRLIHLHDAKRLKRISILRLSPVYDSQWSLNLEKRVLTPQKIVYMQFGSGHQKMSAISRDNLIHFIMYLIDNQDQLGRSFCNIYNVCDEKNYTFQEIINTFRKSEFQPDRPVITVSLTIVWILTRLGGRFFKKHKNVIHSFYNKLANDLIFDNKKMLATGFKPKHDLKTIFLKHKN